MPGGILIVDDHEIVRRGIRSLLSARPGWNVCGEATDGIDALEKARRLRPDVVLMDISMPRMDGLEATRIIHRDLPGSKVIIVSQNEPEIVRLQASEVKADGYVSKSDLAQLLVPGISKLIGAKTSDATGLELDRQTPPAGDWLAGGSTMAQLIRERDWSETSLGPIETWPQSLKTSLSICLASRFPIVLYWGRELVVLYNDAYSPILGTKHPWALGQRCRDCWSEIWPTIGPMLEGVHRTGEATWSNDLLLVLHRHGYPEECYFSFSFSPVRVEAGSVGGVFTAVIETTDSIIGQRRLRTLRDLAARAVIAKTEHDAYRTAAQTLSENLYDIPFSALFASVNRQFQILASAGIPADHPLSSLFSDPASRITATLQRVVDSGQVVTLDLRTIGCELSYGAWDAPASEALLMPIPGVGQDASPGVLMCAVSPKKKLDESYRTFFSIVTRQVATSIADARSHEQERKRAEALAELDRAKTTFFSNVSHEFRTPLTLMLGPVEDLLVRGHAGLSSAAKSQLELVNRNGSRLLRLVNTLLDFSRIEAGRMQAIYLPTDLAAFTVELASVFRSATDKAGLQLELDCPVLEQPVYVDRGMWEKIVLNLISNAFKFTFKGKISVSLTAAGNHAELRVSDTGVGIPRSEIPRLFDRFHRVENTRSRTHEGSGIGLALVHELVKLHGGSVRVESVLGEGSTFIVSLPLGSAHLPAQKIGGNRTLATTALGAAPFVEEALRWLPGVEVSELHKELPGPSELIPVPYIPVAHHESRTRPHVLVADDNADMRQYLVRLLTESYDVKAVPNGRAALESARERTPDLVLTDIMMPEIDGFGLLRELRSGAGTSTVPIILLSARAGEEARVEGMKHGADDYLTKPFSARELLARVQTHLQLASVRKNSEMVLRQRTAQFETLLSEAPLGVYLVDADFRVRHANPPACLAFGNIPDLIGRDFREVAHILWPKKYADEVVERFRHTLESGESYFEPERVEDRADLGVTEINEWQINRIPLPEGGFGVVCYFRDISRQVQAREATAKSQGEAVAATAKFRAVFDQTPVFAGIMSLDGAIVDANQLCLEACGYRAEELLGHVFWETPWWRRSAGVQAKIRAATADAAIGIPFREILTYSWADDSEHLADFAIYPIRDAHDKIIFLHLTGVDVTDLKFAEEKYRRLAESLDTEVRARTSEVEQQSEQLRDLSSRLLQAQDEQRRHIARELHDSAGQILAALGISISQASRVSQKEAPRLAKYTEESQRLVQQLSQEIRTMSYLLHPPLLDETGLIEPLRWYVQGITERTGLEIALELPKNFQRLSRELELVIFRLVQECLTNIHRHSESRCASIRITRDADNLSIEVQDSGKGIPAEKLREIQSQGAGVGIRGMRERVRQFGGQMHIDSTRDGTKIWFKFPLRKVQDSDSKAASHTLGSKPGSKSKG